METSHDPDTATAHTLQIMRGHIGKAAVDVGVQQAAADAAQQFGGIGLGGNDLGVTSAEWYARAAWWWCHVFIKFKHHNKLIRQWLGQDGQLRGFEPGQFGLQGLITPDVLIRMRQPVGDCAIFSDCIAAFLRVFGIPYEFVTVAVNPNEPETFSHVYLYAVMPDGARLPLDASHGQYPGWQVPSAHVSRRQVWDASGNPVADRGSRFDGLGNYGVRGLGASGVDPQSGEAWGTDIVAPAQGTSQWASFATSLAKMGFDLAAINAIKPGTVVTPTGILMQNPGYAVGTPTMSANLGISTTTLMLGGVALLAAVFMFSGKGR